LITPPFLIHLLQSRFGAILGEIRKTPSFISDIANRRNELTIRAAIQLVEEESLP